MTGIVLSVSGNLCIALDKDGIVHKFTVSGEVLPGKKVVIPGTGRGASVRRASSIVSLAAALMLVVIGVMSYIQMTEIPEAAPDTAYYTDGQLVIEDANIALAEVPESGAGGRQTAYICWAVAGILVIGSAALLIIPQRRWRIRRT